MSSLEIERSPGVGFDSKAGTLISCEHRTTSHGNHGENMEKLWRCKNSYIRCPLKTPMVFSASLWYHAQDIVLPAAWVGNLNRPCPQGDWRWTTQPVVVYRPPPPRFKPYDLPTRGPLIPFLASCRNVNFHSIRQLKCRRMPCQPSFLGDASCRENRSLCFFCCCSCWWLDAPANLSLSPPLYRPPHLR